MHKPSYCLNRTKPQGVHKYKSYKNITTCTFFAIYSRSNCDTNNKNNSSEIWAVRLKGWDPRSGFYLVQISLAIQHDNTANVKGTFQAATVHINILCKS